MPVRYAAPLLLDVDRGQRPHQVVEDQLIGFLRLRLDDRLDHRDEPRPLPVPVRTAAQAVLMPDFRVEIEMWAVKA